MENLHVGCFCTFQNCSISVLSETQHLSTDVTVETQSAYSFEGLCAVTLYKEVKMSSDLFPLPFVRIPNTFCFLIVTERLAVTFTELSVTTSSLGTNRQLIAFHVLCKIRIFFPLCASLCIYLYLIAIVFLPLCQSVTLH